MSIIAEQACHQHGIREEPFINKRFFNVHFPGLKAMAHLIFGASGQKMIEMTSRNTERRHDAQVDKGEEGFTNHYDEETEEFEESAIYIILSADWKTISILSLQSVPMVQRAPSLTLARARLPPSF